MSYDTHSITHNDFCDIDNKVKSFIKNFNKYVINILDILLSEDQNDLELIEKYYNKINTYYINCSGVYPLNYLYTHYYNEAIYVSSVIKCLKYIMNVTRTIHLVLSFDVSFDVEKIREYIIATEKIIEYIIATKKIITSVFRKRNINYIKLIDKSVDNINYKFKNVVIWYSLKYNCLKYPTRRTLTKISKCDCDFYKVYSF